MVAFDQSFTKEVVELLTGMNNLDIILKVNEKTGNNMLIQ